MPTILFDHSRAQFHRWLLRNSPAIPIAIAIALVLIFTTSETIHLITWGFSGLCLFVMLWGAVFRRYLIYTQDNQIVCEYRFLGLFTIERTIAPISDCLAVRYHAWQVPYGNERIAYYGAIYLHFMEAKPWRICDQGNYSMDIDCDEPMAEQLAAALGIPVEKVQERPTT